MESIGDILHIMKQKNKLTKMRLIMVLTGIPYHTPRTRRLTCPKCGRRGMCVEVYAEKDANAASAEN